MLSAALSSRLKRAERDGKAQLEKLQRELAAAKSSLSSRPIAPTEAPETAASESAQVNTASMDWRHRTDDR